MQIVGARFADDIDDAACVLAELSAIVARLNAKLLKGVGSGKRRVHIAEVVDILRAVEAKADLILARAVGRDCYRHRKGLGFSLIGLAGGRNGCACNQRRQRRRVTAVQRHFDHARGIHNLAQCLRRGVHLRRRALDRDGLTRRADFQLHVRRGAFIGLQRKTRLNETAKRLRFHSQAVGRRTEIRYDIVPVAGCFYRAA
jgi:hypothetical protein